MIKYSCCPSCGFNQKSGLFTGAYFNIYKCKDCTHLFCYECGKVNPGIFITDARCPKCGGNAYKHGECYLRD